jgi:hypothetical protein
MGRSEVLASLRLIVQEYEAGEIESLVCTTVTVHGGASTLAWPGGESLSLLGAMTLAKDSLSSWHEEADKKRRLR